MMTRADTIRTLEKPSSARALTAGSARLSIAAALACILALAALHVLSPEFAPSFRVVSEYANGKHGWALSLMFACWAVGSWALAIAIGPLINGVAGKIGLCSLITAGTGEAMASVYDLHHPLHEVAGLLGVLGLPVAAMLISPTLIRIPGWEDARKALLWTANLTWVILMVMIAALMAIHRVNMVGYPNRLLVVLYCVWTIVVARETLRRQAQKESMAR